ncbi:MAG: DUF2892 domain-containing protein [Phycisphaeraceae bacterium]
MLHPYESQQRSRSGSQQENVGQVDRWISGLFGTSLLFSGLRRGGLFGLIRSGIGSALVYRGLTGHCPVQASLDEQSSRHAHAAGRSATAPVDSMAATQKKQPPHIRHASHQPPDKVQEASEESFPASDAPGWSADRPM